MNWMKDTRGGNPLTDKNQDGVVNAKEWKTEQGTSFTYKLNDSEVDELIKMLFNLLR